MEGRMPKKKTKKKRKGKSAEELDMDMLRGIRGFGSAAARKGFKKKKKPKR